MGEWKKGVPATPGRYWFRAEPRRDGWGPEYGLALVRWQDFRAHCSRLEPVLAVRSTVMFGAGFHTDTDDGYGWSSGNTMPDGAEFWTEQLQAPPGLTLPDVPGLAPAPTDAELAQREAQEATKRQEAQAKRAEAESQVAEAIQAAVREGTTLVVCLSCDDAYVDDDAVVIRECPHCEEGPFDGSEGAHCPTCNRPFTRNTGEVGCPGCLTNVDDSVVMVLRGTLTDDGRTLLTEWLSDAPDSDTHRNRVRILEEM